MYIISQVHRYSLSGPCHLFLKHAYLVSKRKFSIEGIYTFLKLCWLGGGDLDSTFCFRWGGGGAKLGTGGRSKVKFMVALSSLLCHTGTTWRVTLAV